LPDRLDVDRELALVRMRAKATADRRVREMTSRLHADGRADRAAMGTPDPSPLEVFRTFGRKMTEVAELWRKALGITTP
jgi:hypothetical protein